MGCCDDMSNVKFFVVPFRGGLHSGKLKPLKIGRNCPKRKGSFPKHYFSATMVVFGSVNSKLSTTQVSKDYDKTA